VKHVVMFSGGIGSWATAKRVAEAHGTADLTLLFTDTIMEDEDLYRFLDEAVADVFWDRPPNLVRLADGRDPWQVFEDERFLGNSGVDPCSKLLKRQPAYRWLKENCDPADTIVYLGLDWTEEHRFDDGKGRGAKARYARNGWVCKAPLCEAPFVTKRELYRKLEEEAGIRLPRLYVLGFPHNNCGGFCIKAGIAHFIHLLRTLPQRFAYHEEKEQGIRIFLGKDVSILKETVNGETRPLTLRDLRLRVEAGGQFDMFEWGGCGCFLEAA
jgi:hypothetical protein